MSMELPEKTGVINYVEPENDPGSDWVIEMEKRLEDSTPGGRGKSHNGSIHKVPKFLLHSKAMKFFRPRVVFLGPYHFKGTKKMNDEIELQKTEIARNRHFKLKQERHTPSDMEQKKKEGDKILEGKEKGESSVGVDESGLLSIVQSFVEKEKKIKESYAEDVVVSGKVLAWMMARDACFVWEVLKSFSQYEFEETQETAESASINRSLIRKQYHPVMTDIVQDVLKMENQLPFWALKDISPHEDHAELLVSALKNLSPIDVSSSRFRNHRFREREYHILQLLRDYMVDNYHRNVPTSDPTYSTCCSKLGDLFFNSCRESVRDNLPGFFRPLVCLGYYFIQTIILIVLSPVLLVMFIIFIGGSFVLSEWESVPTVEELNKMGVTFKRLNGKKRGISHIKFKSSTLYLPQFKVDNMSEVILRNLIAFEMCTEEEEKPITRYAMMMNDLINTREDVAILRGEDIIINRLGSDEEVAELWNSIVPSTVASSYSPVDDVASGIIHYRKSKWKILWAQFVMTHCSKPWLVLSLLAGFILLISTVLQTICLFVSCQAK